MPPFPYHPRDVVRVVASIDRTLQSFFYNNSNISAISGTTKATNPTALVPGASLPSSRNKSKGDPVRPGVILSLSSDSATVAMFTTLRGKGISEVKGILRPVMAVILPVNHKHDPTTAGWLPTLGVYPPWRTPATAKHTLCLCLRHKVPIDKLKPWDWRDGSAITTEKPRMCKDGFRLLQQLCEKNEGLRGLFASESWLFEELSLADFMKRRC